MISMNMCKDSLDDYLQIAKLRERLAAGFTVLYTLETLREFTGETYERFVSCVCPAVDV